MVAGLRMSQLTGKCMQVLELSSPKPQKIYVLYLISDHKVQRFLHIYFGSTCFLFAFYKIILIKSSRWLLLILRPQVALDTCVCKSDYRIQARMEKMLMLLYKLALEVVLCPELPTVSSVGSVGEIYIFFSAL